jgi:acyl-CoA synthetase (NDP forming)
MKLPYVIDNQTHVLADILKGLLTDHKGRSLDVAAIEEALLRVSRLVEEVPEIAELDLNPLFALPPGNGCAIADARIRVQG